MTLLMAQLYRAEAFSGHTQETRMGLSTGTETLGGPSAAVETNNEYSYSAHIITGEASAGNAKSANSEKKCGRGFRDIHPVGL